MKTLLFTFCLSLSAASLFSMELFVTATYLNAYKTDYMMVHDLEGEVIYYETIKKKHYRNGLTIDLEDAEVEKKEWFLTSIRIYERDGRPAFSNFSFSGLGDGYVLDYRKSGIGLFSNNPLHPVSIQFTDVNAISKIDTLYGVGLNMNWNKSNDGSGRFYNAIPNNKALFLVAYSSLDSTLYYYYDEEYKEVLPTAWRNLLVSTTSFKRFDAMKSLQLKDSITAVTVRLHNELTTDPIIFRNSPVVDNLVLVPFPASVNVDRYDIILENFSQKTADKSFTYYTSSYSLDNAIEIPSYFSEATYDQNENLSIVCDKNYTFFDIRFGLKDDTSGVGGIWMLLGSLQQKMKFKLPKLPDSIARKYDINSLETKNCQVSLLTADTGRTLLDITAPMLLNDADWRIKNNCIEVRQTIPLDILKHH